MYNGGSLINENRYLGF